MTETLLQLQEVSARVGSHLILNRIRLQVLAGQWTCIVGPNGAGKSTLLRVLAGLQPVTGHVRFRGRPWSAWSPRERASCLAWLGQSQEEDGDWPVRELVAMGRLAHRDRWGFSSPIDDAYVEEALQQWGLEAWRVRPLRSLSAGQRQRARMARLTASQAPVLMMDEPVANLDPPHQADWLAWAKTWGQGANTLVTVLHELPLAMQADQWVVMRAGEVVHVGSPLQAATREAVEAVFDDRIRLESHSGQWVSLWR